MKKKAIIFIIMISSVSLIGIVFTQLYWVKKSLNLKGEQFDNSSGYQHISHVIANAMMLYEMNDQRTEQIQQWDLLREEPKYNEK